LRRLQVWAFILMAVVGGYIGSVFTSFNTWICLIRKRWSGWISFRVLEVREGRGGGGLCGREAGGRGRCMGWWGGMAAV
jgi:hypothetical protein